MLVVLLMIETCNNLTFHLLNLIVFFSGTEELIILLSLLIQLVGIGSWPQNSGKLVPNLALSPGVQFEALCVEVIERLNFQFDSISLCS